MSLKDAGVEQIMSTNYREVLNPNQAKEMGRFLRLMIWAWDEATEVGVKPNVDGFIKEWRGIPTTVEEKRQRARRKQADYKKRKRAVGG
ncbi:hypothetical protein [Desulfosporosinus youngiae]|uniref:Uncharacterized protein n=1 Tax=Desulfosporosinus youngiae DSM 17734 TaxID=768710 RepID=H5Y255_9FIRM|nr:hypothetical protein [Desulfosporosinus youngiae]EHQ88253.1 hypothetical protein DesyoDRAFT_1082 [Desulfosporosinus youngiae DSM 17734]